MQECGYIVNGATRLWCDNQSAIVVAKNPTHHGKTKHIDICYHFIKGLVTYGVIALHHYSTESQLADIFTKPLPPEKHSIKRRMIGMRTLQSRGSVEYLIEGTKVRDDLGKQP